MRLLLVSPRSPESFWSFKWALEKVLPEKRAINPPLGLATVAALCPESWEVEIVDENVQSIPLDPRVDVVGVCGMGVQFRRQRELLALYRNKGYTVVAGGSYASLCPEAYGSLADTVVAGEAEYVWPEFCHDLEVGRPRKLYHEIGVVSLQDSPVPRFDLLKLPNYQTLSLQFSRGCPYRCEFCDIVVMFGRKPRTKALAQIRCELDALRKLSVHNAFFVDDNLIGNKRAAKQLLEFLRDYQREHAYRFHFGTQASLNLAQDDELLALFREAHFAWVFIGIESPDELSLREAKKFQNTGQDILSSVRHVHSYGIEVLGGFIVGFDNDTVETFDRQCQFIMRSGIQAAMIGLLTAAPKTPLAKRLAREGRLIPGANNLDHTRLATNILPKRMGYDEMLAGYRALQCRLLHYRGIAGRIKNKFRYLRSPAAELQFPLKEQVRILCRFAFRGLLPGGVARVSQFMRSVPWSRPRIIPLAVQDWIIGLSMRDYFNRHCAQELGTVRQLTRQYVRPIERACRHYVRQGSLEVSLGEAKDSAVNVSILMKGRLDRDFFTRVTHHLEKVLEETASSVTLRIEELHETQRLNLEHLLDRLAQYGDRIHVAVREELRSMIEIDSSIFNLVLES
jgi:radical SAM superfamily enzyme YgiQ (UPF0313 family)